MGSSKKKSGSYGYESDDQFDAPVVFPAPEPAAVEPVAVNAAPRPKAVRLRGVGCVTHKGRRFANGHTVRIPANWTDEDVAELLNPFEVVS